MYAMRTPGDGTGDARPRVGLIGTGLFTIVVLGQPSCLNRRSIESSDTQMPVLSRSTCRMGRD